MKVAILCGGRGERMGELTADRPKALVELAGRPLVEHVMAHFAAHGFREFVLAVGYRYEAFQWYLRGEPDWDVTIVPTGGARVQNAGRLRQLAKHLGPPGAFWLAWCDGVTDLDLGRMLAFHEARYREGRAVCTVAAAHPPGRFGVLTLDGDAVSGYAEKAAGAEWVSGGVFVCEPGVLALIDGDATEWERGPLPQLAAIGQLSAYRHEGFWRCVDTPRDLREAEAALAERSAR